MLTRDEYVAKMKRQLDEWSADMSAWEANVHEVQADARLKYQQQLGELRAKWQEGEKKLDAVRTAGDDSWEQFKGESENVWGAFKDSARAFTAHFKK